MTLGCRSVEALSLEISAPVICSPSYYSSQYWIRDQFCFSLQTTFQILLVVGLLAAEEAEELLSLLHPKIRLLPFHGQQYDKLPSFLQLLQENSVFADLSGHMLKQEVSQYLQSFLNFKEPNLAR